MKIDCLNISEIPDDILLQASKQEVVGVFYQKDILQLWKNTYGWQGVALTSGNNLFCGFIKSIFVGKIFFSLPYGWYGGFVGDDITNDFMQNVLNWLRRNKFLQINISQFNQLHDSSLNKLFSSYQQASQIVDLTSDLTYSKSTTRNVNKSQQHKFQVKHLTLDDFPAFLKIRKEHTEITGKVHKHAVNFYQELFKLTSSKNNNLEINGIYDDSNLLVCHIYLHNHQDSYHFDTFISSTGREKLANYFLRDHALNEAQQLGRKRFNFGSTPTGDSELLRFKASWGAQIVSYNEYIYKSNFKKLIDKLRGVK